MSHLRILECDLTTCEECFADIAKEIAIVLELSETRASHQPDVYFAQWLPPGDERADTLKVAVIDLCRANDLAGLALEAGLNHEDCVSPDPLFDLSMMHWVRPDYPPLANVRLLGMTGKVMGAGAVVVLIVLVVLIVGGAL